MRKEHVRHKTLRCVDLTLPVRWWRSQGLENRQMDFRHFFAFGGSQIRPRLPYRDFWFCHTIDGCQEVVAQACACFSTIEPFHTIDVHSRKPIFMAGRAGPHRKKSYRNLKKSENRQKAAHIRTLQKSTTRTDGWFGKLRLGAR